MKGWLRVVCVMAAIAPAMAALGQAELARTPPMGWNSWNHYHGKIDDAIVRSMADALVATGMRDEGYIYVNIDDTWEGQRDADGYIQSNERFPNMKALAEYVHSKGLKLGIYSSPGPTTCEKYPGSYEHEEQDAKTYAAWGIDYLKYDLCGFRNVMKTAPSPEDANRMMIDAYAKMHKALLATGRPMVFSLCQYGNDAVWEWGASVGGNLWRTTQDVTDNFARMETIGFSQAGLSRFAGPGHWNDPDLLEVGNGGMSKEEYRTQMSLWAIVAAPLIATNDLTTMSPETKAILMNRDVIAIDQDALGRQGDRVQAEGPVEIWKRPLVSGGLAIGMFNRHPGKMKARVELGKLGVSDGMHVRDVWAGEELHVHRGPMTFDIPGHGVVLLRVTR